jgi:putative hemolysin
MAGPSGTDWLLLAAVVVLFFLTGAFSVAETSLVATPLHKARALAEQSKRGARALLYLVERPKQYLSTILLLVFACQTTGATLFGIAIEHAFKGVLIAAATATEVLVVFFLAEAIPKNWALAHSERAALFMAPMVAALVRFPPMRVMAGAIDAAARVLARSAESQPSVSESEIVALAEVAAEERVIEGHQQALIHSIIHFGDTLAREVMTPRGEIVATSASKTVSDTLGLALERGFSRIPVYRESLDDAVGVAVVKDLVALERRGLGGDPVGDHAREIRFFPETKKVSALLSQMRQEGLQLVLLVDEYGSVSGLVTIEDLVEELVGEIVDEYDVAEPQFEVIGPDEVRISGRMSIDAARELTRADLPEGDWDTVGGLLMAKLGRVPRPGEYVALDGFVVVADRVVGRRISRVRIRKVSGGPSP